MKITRIDLLTPVLLDPNFQERKKQIALEIYLEQLQLALEEKAVEYTRGKEKDKNANRFLALVLLHERTDELIAYLAEEQNRQLASTSELAGIMLHWIRSDPGPIAEAMQSAREKAQLCYSRGHKGEFPIQEESLPNNLNDLALREFLAQALRRLKK